MIPVLPFQPRRLCDSVKNSAANGSMALHRQTLAKFIFGGCSLVLHQTSKRKNHILALSCSCLHLYPSTAEGGGNSCILTYMGKVEFLLTKKILNFLSPALFRAGNGRESPVTPSKSCRCTGTTRKVKALQLEVPVEQGSSLTKPACPFPL